MQHQGVRAKTGWLRIMCLRQATCLPVDKDWLAQDNVSEAKNMSTCRLLFHGASTIKLSVLV